jgi:hypothetical protein
MGVLHYGLIAQEAGRNRYRVGLGAGHWLPLRARSCRSELIFTGQNIDYVRMEPVIGLEPMTF